MQPEFITYYKATIQTVWLKNFVSMLHIVDSISNPITIHYDKVLVIIYSKNNKRCFVTLKTTSPMIGLKFYRP